MKQIIGFMLGLLALLIAGSPAAQLDYPEKSRSRLVAGFPASVRWTCVARVLGLKLARGGGGGGGGRGGIGKVGRGRKPCWRAGNIAQSAWQRRRRMAIRWRLAANAQPFINPSHYKLSYDPVKDSRPSRRSIYRRTDVFHNAVARESSRVAHAGQSAAGWATFPPVAAVVAPHLAGSVLSRMAGVDTGTSYEGRARRLPDPAWGASR